MLINSRFLACGFLCALALNSKVGLGAPATAPRTIEDVPPRTSQDTRPPVSQDPPPKLLPPATREHAEKARFSFGRYLLESLGSGIGVGLLAYGGYYAACGKDPCLGGFLVSSVVSVGATPLGTWVIGNALGGEGSLGSTYLVGLSPFGVTASGSDLDPLALFAIQVALEPFAAALGYELSSNIKANKLLQSAGIGHPRLAPWVGAGSHMDGFGVRASASF